MEVTEDPQRWRSALERETAVYLKRHAGSRGALERLSQSMPGGDTRSATWFTPHPVVIDHAAGPEMWDVDGNRLLDFLGNYTELVHGHAPTFVRDAIAEHLERGFVFAAPLVEQADLAEQLVGRLPAADKVRFCNSGTEATMLAARLARAVTRRQRVATAQHSYHGSSDDLDWSAAARTGTAVFPINDVAAAREVLDAAGPLAAIFIEPVLGAGGVIPVDTDFLAFLRDYASASGAVLVFDEVMTFRLGFGGRQEVVGVEPDLTALAKVIGGGLPIGAVAGRDEVMKLSDPTHTPHIRHSGTNNGNRLAMVAGAAAMRALDGAAVEHLNRLGDRLTAGLRAAAESHPEVPVSVTSCGSLVGIHAARGVTGGAQAAAAGGSDLTRYLHLALLNRGVFMAPRGEMCTSTCMDEAHLDAAVAAFAGALDGA